MRRVFLGFFFFGDQWQKIMGSDASESLGIMHEHLAAFAPVLTLCVYFLNSVEYFTLCEFFCLFAATCSSPPTRLLHGGFLCFWRVFFLNR